jgi:DNA mismatch repair protein MutL
MSDVIRLLPDSIANQIAAGEVVQRPASAVKELLENSVDAGAKHIKLIVKDAGKTLIQVIDDGSGMSETDARMCFERHATSKIQNAADLFAIRTMGFRGEALASIASIAQVELRTRREADELATRIVIEGFELKTQEPCQAPAGTDFRIKNLFYNVPARRNFLKSNTVEMRHILDEFERVAFANSEIFFSLHHNGQELFHLHPGNLRQRIVGIFGKETNKKLVPVNEDIDIIRINGFVGKPEFAKKTRGEQFFFVNNRFIKSSYLHHAVVSAFEELIPKDAFPFYMIFLDINPARIDVNVHPTKQEIKFDDERLIYNYLKVAIRHALGQHAVTPSLDFHQDSGLFEKYLNPQTVAAPVEVAPAVEKVVEAVTETGTPPTKKESKPGTSFKKEVSERDASNLQNWESLYQGLTTAPQPTADAGWNAPPSSPAPIQASRASADELDDLDNTFSKNIKEPYQIQASYIVSHIKSGFILIDQQAASERIMYEKYLDAIEEKNIVVQQILFPRTLRFSTSDAVLLKEILPEINNLGFDIQEFGGGTFIVHGVPADWNGQNEQKVIEHLIEQFKKETDLRLNSTERIARSMARQAAIKRGTPLNIVEMRELIDRLFACSMPFVSPAGRKCFITYDLETLNKQFEV